jgi:hypothetical protein
MPPILIAHSCEACLTAALVCLVKLILRCKCNELHAESTSHQVECIPAFQVCSMMFFGVQAMLIQQCIHQHCTRILFSLSAFVLSTLAFGMGFHADYANASDEAFHEVVRPFLTKHCYQCHADGEAEGEFTVDTLQANFDAVQSKAAWTEVVNVLNSHEMPPESEPQPSVEAVGQVVDWITERMAAAELDSRGSAIVLRRLNRFEYQNTIRDLVGLDVDVSGFPQDPPAGGFDNNGNALTLSPLLLELYFRTAQQILDKAIVREPQPPTIRWRFEPESGDGDGNRVTYDGQRVIVNGGKNPVVDGFKVMHHESWDRHLNIRDFALKHPGKYVLRIRAGGKVPSCSQVVESAETFLAQRRERENKERPQNENHHQRAYDETLEHFRTDPMYDYGPPRVKVTQTLGGQPRVIDEFDVPASLDTPDVYEVPLDFSTERAGFELVYAYSIPRVLENFWFQTSDDFARPELWVDWIELEGPIHPKWPPDSHQRVLLTSDWDIRVDAPNDRLEKGNKIVKAFMQRAYRRPVTTAELASKMELFDPNNNDFVEAIKLPLSAVMVSPHFLFLVEPASEPASEPAVEPVSDREATPKQPSRELTPFELAARLSYFLWSSMPDDRLFRLAAQGQLSNTSVLLGEVDRMLADPKSQAFVDNFAGQWLGLRDVGANPPAEDLFPRYDRHLEQSIVEESKAFFAEILRNDLDVLNFVKSDFVVINERLGRFYGIPDVRGDHFRSVAVPDGVHRGGVVTQASVLTTTSNGTRTSPVKRGTWVMKNILGIDPGLPVANAGDIAPKVPGIDKATVRQRLEIHRELPQCARCHNKIDPLGFALENFDASGAWRDREGFGYKGRIGDNDPWIDASAKMIDGTEFEGVDGLRDVMLQKENLFLRCLASKLLTYALARELGVADGLQVNAAVESLKSSDRTLRSMIHWIVQSETFQTR